MAMDKDFKEMQDRHTEEKLKLFYEKYYGKDSDILVFCENFPEFICPYISWLEMYSLKQEKYPEASLAKKIVEITGERRGRKCLWSDIFEGLLSWVEHNAKDRFTWSKNAEGWSIPVVDLKYKTYEEIKSNIYKENPCHLKGEEKVELALFLLHNWHNNVIPEQLIEARSAGFIYDW